MLSALAQETTLGLLLYYVFALTAGVVLGLLLAFGIEPTLQSIHRKSVATRWVVWAALIAGTGLFAVAWNHINQGPPGHPAAMSWIGDAVFWMILFPASLLCAAVLGAIVLWPRVDPRVVSFIVIVSMAIAWGVSYVWSWKPLKYVFRMLGIELFGWEGLVKPNTWFGTHAIVAAALMGMAALIVNIITRRKARDSNPHLFVGEPR